LPLGKRNFVGINQIIDTMKKTIGLICICSTFLMTACGNEEVVKKEEPIKMEANAEKTYPASLVNNKKDPSCGMPVTAGISDTAHYEKYILGFCSEECKKATLDSLQKNPKSVLAAAEINSSATSK
jgi:YHS domain-containing protein